MMDRLLREGNPPAGQLASPKPQYKDVQTNSWEELKGEGGASYVKDKDVFAKLEQTRVLLEAISGKDFATQTTLAAVLAKLADLESELATIKANQLSGDQKVQLSGTIVDTKQVFYNEVMPASTRVTLLETNKEVIIHTMGCKLRNIYGESSIFAMDLLMGAAREPYRFMGVDAYQSRITGHTAKFDPNWYVDEENNMIFYKPISVVPFKGVVVRLYNFSGSAQAQQAIIVYSEVG